MEIEKNQVELLSYFVATLAGLVTIFYTIRDPLLLLTILLLLTFAMAIIRYAVKSSHSQDFYDELVSHDAIPGPTIYQRIRELFPRLSNPVRQDILDKMSTHQSELKSINEQDENIDEVKKTSHIDYTCMEITAKLENYFNKEEIDRGKIRELIEDSNRL